MAALKEPGIQFTIRDGGLVAAQLEPTTERLLIIGNALDGPVNVPIRVNSLTQAEAIFGPLTYTKGFVDPITGTESGKNSYNTLVLALYEAMIGGAGNVVLVRAGGTRATYSATGNVLGMTVVAPGRIYNGVRVSVVHNPVGASGMTRITITQPAVKGGVMYSDFQSTTTTLQEVCDKLNSDARNSTIYFSVPAVSGTLMVSTLTAYPSGIAFSGGTYGTAAPGEDYYASKAGYYATLTATGGTFETLASAEFNLALLTGIYADDQVVDGAEATTTSVATDFARFLHVISSEAQPVHGVIGLRPTGLRTPGDLKALADNNYLATTYGNYGVAADRWIKFGPFMKDGFSMVDPYTGETVDIGKYLSVVAGPDVILYCSGLNSSKAMYNTNGAAVYAGLVSSIAAHKAATNKALGAVSALLGNFPQLTRAALISGVGKDDYLGYAGGGAYVVFKTSQVVGVPVVVQDNTAALRTSDYAVLQILRIVNLASQLAKQVLFPYIGEPNTVEARGAMKTNLKSAFDKMVEAGMLLGGDSVGYDFAITSDRLDQVFTQINVTMRLRPSLQIRDIIVTVSVSQ